MSITLVLEKATQFLKLSKKYGKAVGRPIPYRIVERRPGDIAACYSDPAKAKEELGWEAGLGITEMCEDAWRWQSKHPNGFDD